MEMVRTQNQCKDSSSKAIRVVRTRTALLRLIHLPCYIFLSTRTNLEVKARQQKCYEGQKPLTDPKTDEVRRKDREGSGKTRRWKDREARRTDPKTMTQSLT